MIKLLRKTPVSKKKDEIQKVVETLKLKINKKHQTTNLAAISPVTNFTMTLLIQQEGFSVFILKNNDEIII